MSSDITNNFYNIKHRSESSRKNSQTHIAFQETDSCKKTCVLSSSAYSGCRVALLLSFKRNSVWCKLKEPDDKLMLDNTQF